MALRVGSAFADFDLSLDPFRRSVELVKAEIGALQRAVATASTGSAVSGARVSPGEAAAARLTREEVQLQQALARTASAEARKAAEANKAAQADTRSAESAAKVALLEQRKQTEISRTAAAQDRAATAAIRRAEVEARAARTASAGNTPLPRTFAGFTPDGFNQALGAFGLATIGPQLVGSAISGAQQAAQNALALQRTLALTKELTGSQEQYNKVIATAKQQQELYGGSLNENIAGIQGLVVTARSTGAELETLINLAQRLAVLDPAQGAEGARIALSEVLSGDPRSLARRYEIPLAALEKIKDESVPVAERLAILDQYLNKIGITSDVVTKTISDQARAYNRVGVELEALQVRAGQGIADFFTPAATGLARLLGLINDNPEAIAQYRALLEGQRQVTQSDVDEAARDVASRRARDSFGGQSARGSAIRGRAVEELGGAEQFKDVLERVGQIELRGSDEAKRAVEALNRELLSGAVNGAQYRQRLDEIERSTNIVSSATQRSGGAFGEAADAAAEAAAKEGAALADSISKRQEAQRLGEQQAQISKAVEEATLRVASGESTQAQEVARLSALYPALAGQFDAIISGQLQLESATDAATAALGRQRIEAQRQTKGATDQSGNIGFNSPGRQGTDDVNAVVRAIEAEREAAATAAERAEAAREAATLRNGTAAQKAEVLQKRYNEAVRQFGKDSAEAISAQADLDALRETGGRRTVDQTAATLGRIEDRTEDHYRRLIQLQEDYQTRASRAQEDFETKRSRDQEDFERRRRRLLAEGKIFEAQQLTEEFQREQRRAREDFDRQQARATEDLATQQQRQAADAGIDTGRIVDRAALRGVRVGSALPQAQTPPVPSDIVPLAQPRPTGLAPQSAALPPIVIQIQERTVQVVMPDGRVIAEATLPFIEQRLAEDLATGQIAVPVGASVAGGPRP